MRKIILLILILNIIVDISGFNVAYSFSAPGATHPPVSSEYIKASEFIKLSFTEFSSLTGVKENLLNKISFSVLKMKVRHELKKNHNVRLSEYNTYQHKISKGLKILLWVAGIVVVLMLTIIIIFGGQKT